MCNKKYFTSKGQAESIYPGGGKCNNSRIVPVPQITPSRTREGAINHILFPIELPTPSPNIRESATKEITH